MEGGGGWWGGAEAWSAYAPPSFRPSCAMRVGSVARCCRGARGGCRGISTRIVRSLFLHYATRRRAAGTPPPPPLPPPPPPPWCRHICRCLYCGRARQPWLLGGDAHPAGDGPSSGAWSIRGRPRRRGMGAAGILHARGTRELATVGAGGEKGGGEEKWRCHGDSGARKRERKMQPTEGGAHRCPPCPCPYPQRQRGKKKQQKNTRGVTVVPPSPAHASPLGLSHGTSFPAHHATDLGAVLPAAPLPAVASQPTDVLLSRHSCPSHGCGTPPPAATAEVAREE